MHFEISSVICSNLDQFKILFSGNGLSNLHLSECFLFCLHKRLNAWPYIDFAFLATTFPQINTNKHSQSYAKRR